MKRTLILLAILFALPLAAQEATITAPDATQIPTKLRVDHWTTSPRAECKCINVVLESRNSSGERIEGRHRSILVQSVDAEGVPTWAKFIAFHSALSTVKAGETGTVERRINFRVLSYLVSDGLLSGVSVTP